MLNWIINAFLKEPEPPAQLRMQIEDDWIVFATRPGKGELGDELAVAAIAEMEKHLREKGVVHETFTRRSPDGCARVVDKIRIPVFRK